MYHISILNVLMASHFFSNIKHLWVTHAETGNADIPAILSYGITDVAEVVNRNCNYGKVVDQSKDWHCYHLLPK